MSNNNGWGNMYNASHGLGNKDDAKKKSKPKPKSVLDKILNSVGLETKKD